jgi:hypothetical protein
LTKGLVEKQLRHFEAQRVKTEVVVSEDSKGGSPDSEI